MNLAVLVPSTAALDSAGVRIRYRRLAGALAEAGVNLILLDIGSFNPLKATPDVVILSKCQDPRSLVVAAILVRRGITVGIDLFDDYFSQRQDSRLNPFRAFLRQMLRLADFAICSTPVLARVVRSGDADIPIHILHDPAEPIEQTELAKQLAEKLAAVRATGTVKLCWFGIGDNPMFPVGLRDLAAFSGTLSRLASTGMAVELTVLTNRRALGAEGLRAIASLPVTTRVEEWSEPLQSAVLQDSFGCFLPVSAQPFSTAKTLNRALTALSTGCQVVSGGYPLYQALDEFIYRDHSSFLEDLRQCRMRLSEAALPALERKMDEIASITRESSALAAFLSTVRSNPSQKIGRTPIALVHGAEPDAAAHDLIKAAGGMSIASPFASAPFDFDGLVTMLPGGELALLVAARQLSRVRRGSTESITSLATQRIGRRKFVQVAGPPLTKAVEPMVVSSLPLQLALYGPVMERTSALLAQSLRPGLTLIAENSGLPFELVD